MRIPFCGTLAFYATEAYTPGASGTAAEIWIHAAGTAVPFLHWYGDATESEYFVPVKAPSYGIGDTPGFTGDVVVGTKTFHIVGGIILSVV